MLHEFITTNRLSIVARTKVRLAARPHSLTSPQSVEHGVELFLTQLSETLRWEATATPFPASAIGSSAARHGRELLESRFDLSQVVHDYGDMCQAITEVAVEKDAPITIAEFHTLNRCLDTAIAEAVTEHARMTARSHANEEVARLGHVAHEVREILKRGTVAINGTTGAILGRSLIRLRDFVDTTLSDIRMAANEQRRTQVPLESLLNDVAVAGALHADYREVALTIEFDERELAVTADRQLLTSALMNLVNNAVKFTRPGGRVVLRARSIGSRLLIEVEDECGGIPDTKADPFQPFGDRRGTDRTGLGLGLSIARKAVRAHGGDIDIRNMPGKGCIFTIDIPLAGDAAEPVHNSTDSVR
jgi:signal transduction histidine kinase